MTHPAKWLACIGLSVLLTLPLAALGAQAAARDPIDRVSELLERMAEALRALNYEGTLVYLHDNQLETLHLVHRVEGGRVQERLVSLSGPVRALTREPGRVTCVLPDGHPISVEQPSAGVSLLDAEGIVPARLGEHYRVLLLGEARVAGRDTEVVGIIPRDALRYGYRFHIDRDTALPLKSDLVDHAGQALEQLMFTSLTLHPGDGSRPEGLERTAPRDTPIAREQSSLLAWRFENLPEGFELVMRKEIPGAQGEGELEHFLFTDRLSAFSIYVEPDVSDGLVGSSRIGSVHAAGRQIAGYQVTAVGEVPAATVEAAIAGVRHTGGAHD